MLFLSDDSHYLPQMALKSSRMSITANIKPRHFVLLSTRLSPILLLFIASMPLNEPKDRKKTRTKMPNGKDGKNDPLSTTMGVGLSFWNDAVKPYVESFNLKKLFRLHAMSLLVMGLTLTILPHSILHMFMHKMDHMTHEVYRLYGVLNISIGWIIWKLRDVGDGRVGRLIAETFAVCFLLQSLVILRAQLTNPAGHDAWHWMLAAVYIFFGSLYAYIRFVKTIKTFELPGTHQD
jgi:hypothetical protein